MRQVTNNYTTKSTIKSLKSASSHQYYFTTAGGADEDFAAALHTSLDEIHSTSDNFKSYIAEAERHCVLKHAHFYTEEMGRGRFRDWVANLANQIEVENVTP